MILIVYLLCTDSTDSNSTTLFEDVLIQQQDITSNVKLLLPIRLVWLATVNSGFHITTTNN